MTNYEYYTRFDNLTELCHLIDYDKFVAQYCHPWPEWQTEDDACTHASDSHCRRCIKLWLTEEREE